MFFLKIFRFNIHYLSLTKNDRFLASVSCMVQEKLLNYDIFYIIHFLVWFDSYIKYNRDFLIHHGIRVFGKVEVWY